MTAIALLWRLTVAGGLRRRRVPAAEALLRRLTESPRLLSVSTVLRIGIGIWLTIARLRIAVPLLRRRPEGTGSSVLRLSAESLLRRWLPEATLLWRLSEAPLLWRLAITSTTVLIIREGHRIDRDGMTMRAIARALGNVVAHLATKRRALSWRRTVRVGRRSAEATLLWRWCSEAGRLLASKSLRGAAHHDWRAADVAKLVRRLRDRAALRTGVHRRCLRTRSLHSGKYVLGQHIGERKKCRTRVRSLEGLPFGDAPLRRSSGPLELFAPKKA